MSMILLSAYVHMKHSLVLRLKEHSDAVRLFVIEASALAQYHVIKSKGTKVLRWTPTH